VSTLKADNVQSTTFASPSIVISPSNGGVTLPYPTGQGTSSGAPTIASAATIAPTTSIVFVSGTTAIATITPPVPLNSIGGQITIIPTGLFTIGTGGNVALGTTAVVGKAIIMTYDPITTKWYPSY
jgi:hypothetical protein